MIETIEVHLRSIANLVLVVVLFIAEVEIAQIFAIWFAILLTIAVVTSIWPQKWKWIFLYVSEFLSLIAGLVVFAFGIDRDDFGLLCTSMGVAQLSVFMAVLTSILWCIEDRKKRKLQQA